MAKDAEKVLAMIRSYDGVLPFNDKASPETIKEKTPLYCLTPPAGINSLRKKTSKEGLAPVKSPDSPNEFKRAVGHLLKENRILIGEKSIRLK